MGGVITIVEYKDCDVAGHFLATPMRGLSRPPLGLFLLLALSYAVLGNAWCIFNKGPGKVDASEVGRYELRLSSLERHGSPRTGSHAAFPLPSARFGAATTTSKSPEVGFFVP